MQRSSHNLTTLPFDYWLRVLGDFLTGFGRSMLFPFMLIYLEQKSGYATWIITLMTAVPQLLQLLTTTWGGYLADCYGRKPIMLASLFGSGAVLLLMFSRNYLIVYLGYTLFLVVSNIYRPAALAMVTEVVPPGQHRDAFAIMRMAANLGFALGPLVGSTVFFSHRPLAVAGTILTYVLTACTVFYMGETCKGTSKVKGAFLSGFRNPLEAFKLLRRDVILLWTIVTAILYLMVNGQLFTTFTVVVNDTFKDDGHTLAYLLLINTVGVVVGQYYISSVTRKISFLDLLVMAMLVSTAGWGLLIVPLGNLRFYLLLVLTTIAEMLMSSGFSPFIASLAHKEDVASYMSFTQTSNALASLVGPTAGAVGYDLAGQKGYVLVLWALTLLSFLCLQVLKQKARPSSSANNYLPG